MKTFGSDDGGESERIEQEYQGAQKDAKDEQAQLVGLAVSVLGALGLVQVG